MPKDRTIVRASAKKALDNGNNVYTVGTFLGRSNITASTSRPDFVFVLQANIGGVPGFEEKHGCDMTCAQCVGHLQTTLAAQYMRRALRLIEGRKR